MANRLSKLCVCILEYLHLTFLQIDYGALIVKRFDLLRTSLSKELAFADFRVFIARSDERIDASEFKHKRHKNLAKDRF
jgi:hypothetical protein